MTGSATIHPAPGTQPSKDRDRSSSMLDSRTVVKVGSIVKGILKGATDELIEDEGYYFRIQVATKITSEQ